MNKDQIIGENIIVLNAMSQLAMLIKPIPGESLTNEPFMAIEMAKAKMMLPPNIREGGE